MLDTQQVHELADHEIDQIVHARRTEVQPRVRRRDDRAGQGQGAHVLDVDQVER